MKREVAVEGGAKQSGSSWTVPVMIQLCLAGMMIVMVVLFGSTPASVYQTLSSISASGNLPSNVVAAVNAPATMARLMLVVCAFLLLVGAAVTFLLARRATGGAAAATSEAQLEEIVNGLQDICDEYQAQRDQFMKAFNTLQGNLKHIHGATQQNHSQNQQEFSAVRSDIASLPGLIRPASDQGHVDLDSALQPVLAMVRSMIDDTRAEFDRVHHTIEQTSSQTASIAASATGASEAHAGAAIDAQLEALDSLKWTLTNLDNRTKVVADDLATLKQDMRLRPAPMPASEAQPLATSAAPLDGKHDVLRAIDAVSQDIRDLQTPVADLRKQIDGQYRQLEGRFRSIEPSLEAVRQSQIDIGTALDGRIQRLHETMERSGSSRGVGVESQQLMESINEVAAQIQDMRRVPSLAAIRDVVGQEVDQRLTGLGHRIGELAVDLKSAQTLSGSSASSDALRGEVRRIAEQLDEVMHGVSRRIDEVRRAQENVNALPSDVVAMPVQLKGLTAEIRDMTDRVTLAAERSIPAESSGQSAAPAHSPELVEHLETLSMLVKELPQRWEAQLEAGAAQQAQAVTDATRAIERVEDRVCEFASTILSGQGETVGAAGAIDATAEAMEAVSSGLQRIEDMTAGVKSTLESRLPEGTGEALTAIATGVKRVEEATQSVSDTVAEKIAGMSAAMGASNAPAAAIDQDAILSALGDLRAEMAAQATAAAASSAPDSSNLDMELEATSADPLAPVIEALHTISEQMNDLNVVVTAGRVPAEDPTALKEFTTTGVRGERILAGLRLLMQDLSDTTTGYRDMLDGLKDMPAATDSIERLMTLITRFEGAVARLEGEQKTVEISLPMDEMGEEPASDEEILSQIAHTVFPPEGDEMLAAGDAEAADAAVDMDALPDFTPQAIVGGGGGNPAQSRAFGKLLAGFKSLLQEMSDESAKLRAVVDATGADLHAENGLADIPPPAWFDARIKKMERTVSNEMAGLEARIGAPVYAAVDRISQGVALSLSDFEEVLRSQLATFGETLSGGQEALETLRGELIARLNDAPAANSSSVPVVAAPTASAVDLSGETIGSMRLAVQLMHGFARSVEDRFEATEKSMVEILNGLQAHQELSSDDIQLLSQGLEATTEAMRTQVQEFLSIAAAVSDEVSRRGSDDESARYNVA